MLSVYSHGNERPKKRPLISQEKIQELVRKQEIYFIQSPCPKRRPRVSYILNKACHANQSLFSPTAEQLEMHLQRTVRSMPPCTEPTEARMVEDIVATTRMMQEERREIPPSKTVHHRRFSKEWDEDYLEALGLPSSEEIALWSRRVYLLIMSGLKMNMTEIGQIRLIRRRAMNRIRCRNRYHENKPRDMATEEESLDYEHNQQETFETEVIEEEEGQQYAADNAAEPVDLNNDQELVREAGEAVEEHDLPAQDATQGSIDDIITEDVEKPAQEAEIVTDEPDPTSLDLKETPVFRTRYQAREYKRQQEDYALCQHYKEVSRLRKERVMRETGLPIDQIEVAEVYDLFYVVYPQITKEQ